MGGDDGDDDDGGDDDGVDDEDDGEGDEDEDVHRGPGEVAGVVVSWCFLDLLLRLVSATRLLQGKKQGCKMSTKKDTQTKSFKLNCNKFKKIKKSGVHCADQCRSGVAYC